MTVLDFSTTNSQITDEVINVADSNPVSLDHDVFYNKTGKLVVISTGAGGTGTVLTVSTDYTVGGVFPDGSLPTSISPDVAYTTIAITNATYHSTDLYVSYYPIMDLVKAARWNTLAPSGMISPFAMASAPSGWLLCDGSAVARGSYGSLFSAIGTTWGAGDGSTTFNLPDLRGAFLRGAGAHGTETDASGTAFTGPAVGAYQDDQMQGHYHTTAGILNRALSAGTVDVPLDSSASQNYTNGASAVKDPLTDGVNGTPRTGSENRPFGAGVYYCIKI